LLAAVTALLKNVHASRHGEHEYRVLHGGLRITRHPTKEQSKATIVASGCKIAQAAPSTVCL